jgi:hypothetical protein
LGGHCWNDRWAVSGKEIVNLNIRSFYATAASKWTRVQMRYFRGNGGSRCFFERGSTANHRLLVLGEGHALEYSTLPAERHASTKREGSQLRNGEGGVWSPYNSGRRDEGQAKTRNTSRVTNALPGLSQQALVQTCTCWLRLGNAVHDPRAPPCTST